MRSKFQQAHWRDVQEEADRALTRAFVVGMIFGVAACVAIPLFAHLVGGI